MSGDAQSYVRPPGFKNIDGYLELDSGAVRTIDMPHTRVHEGELFFAADLVLDFGIGAKYYYAHTTPVDKFVHFQAFDVAAEDGLLVMREYKDCTVTGGTTLEAVNRNHNSTKVDPTIVKKGVTYTPVPADIVDMIGIAGGRNAGGSGASNTESIWKPDTTYVLEIENISGAQTKFVIRAFWYVLDIDEEES